MNVDYGKGLVGGKGVKTKGEIKIKNNRCRNGGPSADLSTAFNNSWLSYRAFQA